MLALNTKINQTEEVWKDIPEYVGFYQLSNLARLKACHRKFKRKDGIIVSFKEKITTPVNEITLWKNNVGTRVPLYRLFNNLFPLESPRIEVHEDGTTEIWEDVIDYGDYQVSNMGNFYNKILRIRLKLNKIKKGYFHITLRKNGIQRTFKAHRLVAANFIVNTEIKSEINHKNAIKTDNRVENLEWVTRQENVYHAKINNLMKGKKGADSHLFGKCRGNSIRAKLILDLQTGIFYDCARDAADAKGMTYAQLKNRLYGRTPNTSNCISPC